MDLAAASVESIFRIQWVFCSTGLLISVIVQSAAGDRFLRVSARVVEQFPAGVVLQRIGVWDAAG